MKRTTSVVIILALFITSIMTGCAGNATPSTTSSSTQGTSSAVQSENEKVTISFFIPVTNIDEMSWLNKTVPEFTKMHPNVTFEYNVSASADSYFSKLRMMAQSNTLSTIHYNVATDEISMIEQGNIADMTKYLDEKWKERYVNGALTPFMIDNKLYGFPEQVGIQGWFYNKALFDQYGLKIPETFEELKQAVKVFKQNGIIPIMHPTKDSWNIWGWELYFFRYGVEDIYKDVISGKTTFNNPQFLKAFQRIDELRQLGAFPENVATLSYGQGKELFIGGKGAIFTTGTWEISSFEDSKIPIVFNWGPTLEDGISDQKIALKNMETGYFIASNSTEAERYWAAEFFKFYAGEDATKILVEKCLIVPASKYAGSVASISPMLDDFLKIANDDYRPAISNLSTLFGVGFTYAIEDSITGVINGTYTPEQAVKMLDDEWKKK